MYTFRARARAERATAPKDTRRAEAGRGRVPAEADYLPATLLADGQAACKAGALETCYQRDKGDEESEVMLSPNAPPSRQK